MTTTNYSLITQFIINCVSWLMFIPTAIFFCVYRKVIDIILMIKVGPKYGGLMERADMAFLAPDSSKCYVTTVMYVKRKEKLDMNDTLKTILEEKIFRCPDQYMKLTSRVQQFGGYAYWLKNEVRVSDIIQPLTPPDSTNLTEDFLKEFAAKISAADNFNDGVYWDIHISTVPLANKKNRYVMVIRTHHCICDGTSLVALFIKLSGDDSAQNYGTEVFSKLSKPRMTTLLLWLDLIFLAMGRVMIQTHLIPNDNNSLHGYHRGYSTRKVVAWSTEEDAQYIALIKKVKSHTNTNFASVVCTAIHDSLTRYFIKNSSEVPDTITGLMAVLLKSPQIDPLEPVVLENKTSFIMYRQPTSENLIELLTSNCQIIKNKEKYTESLFLSGYALGNLPFFMQKPCMGFRRQTVIISNIPGGSQLNMLDGCTVEKVIPLVPNTRGVGLCISILSYNDRLHVGVLVDQSLVKSQAQVQMISDGVFDSIRRLDAECQQSYID